MSTLPALYRKVISNPKFRMVLVGGLSVVCAYLVFLLLVQLGVHYLIASVVNFTTYWILNFFLNKHWSFKSQGNVKKEALAHISLHVGNQLLMMLGLFVLVEYGSLHPGWSQLMLQIGATITVFLITPIIFSSKKAT